MNQYQYHDHRHRATLRSMPTSTLAVPLAVKLMILVEDPLLEAGKRGMGGGVGGGVRGAVVRRITVVTVGWGGHWSASCLECSAIP